LRPLRAARKVSSTRRTYDAIAARRPVLSVHCLTRYCPPTIAASNNVLTGSSHSRLRMQSPQKQTESKRCDSSRPDSECNVHTCASGCSESGRQDLLAGSHPADQRASKSHAVTRTKIQSKADDQCLLVPAPFLRLAGSRASDGVIL
jgi:hypothetical protein